MDNYEFHLSGASSYHKQGYKGQSVTVAVIDTGCMKSHIAFKSGQVELKSFSYGTGSATEGQDDDGHGTWCCSKVVEIAPDVKILSLKVGNTVFIDNLDIIECLEYCLTRSDVNMISMSIGIETFTNDAQRVRFENAVNGLWTQGKPVICSAGNSGDDRVIHPACMHNVITVGSIDKELDTSYFSSISNEVDVCQIGVNAQGADWQNLNGYKLMTGTSMSTPLVAGLCALIHSRYFTMFGVRPTSEDLYRELLMHTLDSGAIGRDNKTGVGIATFHNEYSIINMYIGNTSTTVKTPNGTQTLPLLVAPQIISGTTMIPVRFVSENMGGKITWTEKDAQGNYIRNVEIRG